MNILALETSRPEASLCLRLGAACPVTCCWQALRNHDAFLFPALQQALEALGEQPLDLILVGAGPGSYGGVRVALAAAVGLSLVRQASVVALPSWLQLTADGTSVFSDAKRGGWTLQQPGCELRVISLDELRELARQSAPLGSVESADTVAALDLPGSVCCALSPTAEGLINSWETLSPEQQAAYAARPAEPIYVRPPHITEAKHKPWELRG